MRTLAALLRSRADTQAGAALRFLRDDGGWDEWSWQDYWRAGRKAASALADAGIRPGERVLVLVHEVEPAVRLLFGLWNLGAVPIQIGMPYRLGDPAAFVAELRALSTRLEARGLVVSPALHGFAGGDDAVLDAGTLLAGGDADDPTVPDPEAAPDTALIQLTSGSTGHARAVVIPHERLLRHMEQMSKRLPSPPHAVGATWLPLHHDMGLIGGLLFPLYNGFVDHMMSPLDFRKRPLVWLETISERRATISPAPPSAYALALRLCDDARARGLDLGSWECAMIGAEPIPPELLRRFADAFAPCRFRAEAFFPVYGLAEATVAVTFPTLLAPTHFDRVSRPALERGRAEPAQEGETLELVGCGEAIPDSALRVVGDDGAVRGEREVGEIQFRSPSVMAGYFREEEATKATLDGDWVKTGDLGYVAGGQLYVTGRKKELIIKGGQNILPWVVEDVVGAVDGVRTGCVVAVGVPDRALATEKLVVVAETKLGDDAHADLVRRIHAALLARGIAADRIQLVAAGSLPKTTSGKLQRRAVAASLEKA
jgi:acyl-CoA synthetase (AMP-forming)/AMP-acid ligase II